MAISDKIINEIYKKYQSIIAAEDPLLIKSIKDAGEEQWAKAQDKQDDCLNEQYSQSELMQQTYRYAFIDHGGLAHANSRLLLMLGPEAQRYWLIFLKNHHEKFKKKLPLSLMIAHFLEFHAEVEEAFKEEMSLGEEVFEYPDLEGFFEHEHDEKKDNLQKEKDLNPIDMALLFGFLNKSIGISFFLQKLKKILENTSILIGPVLLPAVNTLSDFFNDGQYDKLFEEIFLFVDKYAIPKSNVTSGVFNVVRPLLVPNEAKKEQDNKKKHLASLLYKHKTQVLFFKLLDIFSVDLLDQLGKEDLKRTIQQFAWMVFDLIKTHLLFETFRQMGLEGDQIQSLMALALEKEKEILCIYNDDGQNNDDFKRQVAIWRIKFNRPVYETGEQWCDGAREDLEKINNAVLFIQEVRENLTPEQFQNKNLVKFLIAKKNDFNGLKKEEKKEKFIALKNDFFSPGEEKYQQYSDEEKCTNENFGDSLEFVNKIKKEFEWVKSKSIFSFFHRLLERRAICDAAEAVLSVVEAKDFDLNNPKDFSKLYYIFSDKKKKIKDLWSFFSWFLGQKSVHQVLSEKFQVMDKFLENYPKDLKREQILLDREKRILLHKIAPYLAIKTNLINKVINIFEDNQTLLAFEEVKSLIEEHPSDNEQQELKYRAVQSCQDVIEKLKEEENTEAFFDEQRWAVLAKQKMQGRGGITFHYQSNKKMVRIESPLVNTEEDKILKNLEDEKKLKRALISKREEDEKDEKEIKSSPEQIDNIKRRLSFLTSQQKEMDTLKKKIQQLDLKIKKKISGQSSFFVFFKGLAQQGGAAGILADAKPAVSNQPRNEMIQDIQEIIGALEPYQIIFKKEEIDFSEPQVGLLEDQKSLEGAPNLVSDKKKLFLKGNEDDEKKFNVRINILNKMQEALRTRVLLSQTPLFPPSERLQIFDKLESQIQEFDSLFNENEEKEFFSFFEKLLNFNLASIVEPLHSNKFESDLHKHSLLYLEAEVEKPEDFLRMTRLFMYGKVADDNKIEPNGFEPPRILPFSKPLKKYNS